MTADRADLPVVTCIVVAYRSARHLPACLRSLSCAVGAHRAEIIVVDNASPDDTAAAVAASSVPAAVVDLETNLGFAGAANVGVRAARGEFVCFLNPDAVAESGSVAALVDAAVRRPGHLLYSGRVVNQDGRLDPGCCLPLPSLWEYTCFATGLSTVMRGHRLFDPASLGGWARDDEQPVPVVSGAFVLAPRERLLALGGWDPRYFMYSEDVDLSHRAHAVGLPPLLVPQAVAVHEGGGSSSSGEKTCMVLRGKATFLRRRWGPPRRAAGLGLLLAGVGLRTAAGIVTGRAPQWRVAWRRRRDWLAGW
jgi:GT2 family glycosyltransferase